jgi:acyl-CoA thioester hydrolase
MHSFSIQPRFCETDALGHIGNTTLPIWFEAARLQFFKKIVSYKKLEEWPLIIARIELNFVRQLFVEHDVEIRTAVCAIGNKSFTVQQEAWQQDQLCAEGKTVMAHFDFKTQSSSPISDTIRANLNQHLMSSC